jgi:hypothetical protein
MQNSREMAYDSFRILGISDYRTVVAVLADTPDGLAARA